MSRQNINNLPTDSGLGDSLYVATTKINEMMIELYATDVSYSGIIDSINVTLATINDGSTLNHQHTIAQIIGLQTALDSKVSTSTFNAQIAAITASIQAINATLSTIIDILNTKIGDAPFSGITYGRQDGAWVEISGGTASQSLTQTLIIGNETLGTNILINDADAIELENGSLLKQGTSDFGGKGGISRICSVGYEDMWQSGIRHVFDDNALIRNSTNCFDIVPDNTFDSTLRFKIGSRWTLDNGDTYECSDASTNAAVWGIVNNIPTNTSQLINDGDDGISHFISNLDLPSNLILYATTASATTAGYFKLVTDIHDPAFNTTAVNVSTGAITTTSQLISSLITAPGIINGNPGIFNVTTIGNITKVSGSGEAEFFFRVYKRTIGGTETFITQSSNTIPVTNTGYSEFSATALWNDGDFLLTDSIVLKFYANRIAGGANPTYQFQFGGITPVRTLVPIPLYAVPGGALDSLSDVTITSPTNKQVLEYEISTGLWKNKTLNTSYLPLSGGTVTGPTTFTDPNLFALRINIANTSDGVYLGDDIYSSTAAGLYSSNGDQLIADWDASTNVYKYAGGSIQFDQNNFITNVTGLLSTEKGTNDGVDLYSSLKVTDYAMEFVGRSGTDYDNFGYSRFVVSPEEGFYSLKQNSSGLSASQIQAQASQIDFIVYTDDGSGFIKNTVTSTDTSEYLETLQSANYFTVKTDIYSSEGLFGILADGRVYLGDFDYSVNGTNIIVNDNEKRIDINGSESVFINALDVQNLATNVPMSNNYSIRVTAIGAGTVTIVGQAGASIVISGNGAAALGAGIFKNQCRLNLVTSTTPGNMAFLRTTLGLITIGSTWECEWLFGTADAATVAGARSFIGLGSFFGAPSNVEPTTLISSVGIARLSTSNNWHIIHNDATGLATTIDLGVNFPSNTLELDLIYFKLNMNANGTVNYYVANMTNSYRTGGLISTNLPAAGTVFYEQMWTTNNTAALAARLAFCQRTFSNKQL